MRHFFYILPILFLLTGAGCNINPPTPDTSSNEESSSTPNNTPDNSGRPTSTLPDTSDNSGNIAPIATTSSRQNNAGSNTRRNSNSGTNNTGAGSGFTGSADLPVEPENDSGLPGLATGTIAGSDVLGAGKDGYADPQELLDAEARLDGYKLRLEKARVAANPIATEYYNKQEGERTFYWEDTDPTFLVASKACGKASGTLSNGEGGARGAWWDGDFSEMRRLLDLGKKESADCLQAIINFENRWSVSGV